MNFLCERSQTLRDLNNVKNETFKILTKSVAWNVLITCDVYTNSTEMRLHWFKITITMHHIFKITFWILRSTLALRKLKLSTTLNASFRFHDVRSVSKESFSNSSLMYAAKQLLSACGDSSAHKDLQHEWFFSAAGVAPNTKSYGNSFFAVTLSQIHKLAIHWWQWQWVETWASAGGNGHYPLEIGTKN